MIRIGFIQLCIKLYFESINLDDTYHASIVDFRKSWTRNRRFKTCSCNIHSAVDREAARQRAGRIDKQSMLRKTESLVVIMRKEHAGQTTNW